MRRTPLPELGDGGWEGAEGSDTTSDGEEEASLADLSAEHAAQPIQPESFYDRAAMAVFMSQGETGLSPELAVALLEGTSLRVLTREGWGCFWMELCAWLPATPGPGGSWRLRAAKAAAARGPDFGLSQCARVRASVLGASAMDRGETWSGNFVSPWAPEGLPHLEEFSREERAEFLALAPGARLRRSLRAWCQEGSLDDEVAGEFALGRERIAERRALLLAAAEGALRLQEGGAQ